MESEDSTGLGTCNTVQISGANEDVDVDIGIPENDQTVRATCCDSLLSFVLDVLIHVLYQPIC